MTKIRNNDYYYYRYLSNNTHANNKTTISQNVNRNNRNNKTSENSRNYEELRILQKKTSSSQAGASIVDDLGEKRSMVGVGKAGLSATTYYYLNNTLLNNTPPPVRLVVNVL